jgi:retinol dehydrogenase 14
MARNDRGPMAGRTMLVTGATFHPGVVRTSCGAEDPGEAQRLAVPLMKPFMKSPDAGPATSVHLASTAAQERVTGEYFANYKPRRSSQRSYDAAASARLWTASEDLVGSGV